MLKPVALPAARTTGIVSLSVNEKLTRFHSVCIIFEHTTAREDCKTVSGLFFRQQLRCFPDSIRGSCRSSCPTSPRATYQALHKGTPRPSRGAFHVMARFDVGYLLCHLFPHSSTGNRSVSYFALQMLDSACLVSRFSPHRTRFSDDIATAKGQRSHKGKAPTTQPGHPRSTVGHAIPFSKLGVFLSRPPAARFRTPPPRPMRILTRHKVGRPKNDKAVQPSGSGGAAMSGCSSPCALVTKV